MSITSTNSAFVVGSILANQFAEPQSQPVMKLDLQKFSTFSADGVNFDLKKYMNESSSGSSIITDKCWNLSRIEREPVPDAYFEVIFTDFNPYYKNARVGVGIGNQIFRNDKLLGSQQNSFGYFNNGEVTHKSNGYYGYFPEWKENDVIGVGILYDSFNMRRLYFTKNGQYLGKTRSNLNPEFTANARVAPVEIHVGQDCFPGVTFVNDAYAKFRVNFTGPFKFDAKTLPNYRYNDKIDRISNLPLEILFDCINMATEKHTIACNLRMVNKRWNDIAKDNRIWKRLFMARFVWANPDLKLRSWVKFYERRHKWWKNNELDAGRNLIDQQFIENCEFEFECPLSWKELSDKSEEDANQRHCDKCNKTVYAVQSIDELKQHSEMGHCVSLVNKEREQGRRGKFLVRTIKIDDELV